MKLSKLSITKLKKGPPFWWFVSFDSGSSLVSKILVVVVQWLSCFKLDGRHGLNDIIEGVVIIF